MEYGSQKEIFKTKAFEVSYAIFRVSQSASPRHYVEHLENFALRLLDAATRERFHDAQLELGSLEYFLRLGAAVNFLGNRNADLIINEAKNLDTAIADFLNSAIRQEPNLEKIFSRMPNTIQIKEISNAFIPEDKSEKQRQVISGEQDDELPREEDVGQNEHGFFNAAMRQSAILNRIRQNGNCRLKDIIEVIPGISERTVRYDLQKMTKRGLIERLGSGGPATYYRTKG